MYFGFLCGRKPIKSSVSATEIVTARKSNREMMTGPFTDGLYGKGKRRLDIGLTTARTSS